MNDDGDLVKQLFMDDCLRDVRGREREREYVCIQSPKDISKRVQAALKGRW